MCINAAYKRFMKIQLGKVSFIAWPREMMNAPQFLIAVKLFSCIPEKSFRSFQQKHFWSWCSVFLNN